MKPDANVEYCPSELINTTFTVPAALGGAFAVTELALLKVTAVAGTPPNSTIRLVLLKKFVPVSVTDVPPLVGPVLVRMLVIPGAGPSDA